MGAILLELRVMGGGGKQGLCGAGFLLGLISRDECELGFILRGLIGLELCRAVILHGLIVRGFVVLVVVGLLGFLSLGLFMSPEL